MLVRNTCNILINDQNQSFLRVYECIALVLDQNSLGNLRIYFCTLALWKRVYIHIHIVKLEENENTIIFGLCCRNVP